MAGYRITAYNADGLDVTVLTVEAGEDGPEFYAHQLLHANDIVRVTVHAEDNEEVGELLLDRSEPMEASDGALG